MSWSADDGGKYSTRCFVTGKTGFARFRSVVNNDSGNVVVVEHLGGGS